MLAFLGLGQAATAEPELKGTPNQLKAFLHPEARTVVIRGHAKETAYSDLAHVSLIVSTTEKTLTESLQANSELRTQLVQSFIQSGIPADRINNAQFSSSPQYGFFGRKPKEYEVVNRLKVTVDGEAQMTRLAKAADQFEAVSIGNMEFEHSLEQETKEKIKSAALENAIQTGRTYAKKLGITMTPVSFHFADIRPVRPLARGRAVEEVVVTATKYGASSAPAAPPPPITFDEVKYQSQVDVVFEVAKQE